MTICDRCRRTPTTKLETWDVCAVCRTDYLTMFGSFFSRQGMRVNVPDVVAIPVPVDDKVQPTVVVDAVLVAEKATHPKTRGRRRTS